MDFIEQLSPSGDYTDILVVVDQLTKQVLFIPTIRSLDATMLAELFIKHVFSKHGIPSHVTSGRGTEFVSKFFRSLDNALDMRLHFTSGYHPEADSQTERTNQTLEDLLQLPRIGLVTITPLGRVCLQQHAIIHYRCLPLLCK